MDSVTAAENIDSRWPAIAVRVLLAACERSRRPGNSVRYEPAVWFGERPTPRRRQAWSRWTRRLAGAGLIERLTEPARDRVTHVRVTEAGRQWVVAHCGWPGIGELNVISLPEPAWPDSAGDGLSE